jgi:hypothetical protein
LKFIIVKESIFLVIVISLMNLGIDARAEETTLCRAHEEVYFSCPVGGKIISLCASGNISPDNGYIRYRFGTPDHVELQYPDDNHSSKSRFTISDISGGNLNFTHVKFKSGGYDYVMYQGFPSGLYIKRKGRTIANLTCDEGIYQQLSQRAYRGMPTVPPVDGIDD